MLLCSTPGLLNADWSCFRPCEGAWRSEYDEYALGGWLALDDADWKQRRSWGATVSSIPDRDGQGWALSVGRLVPATKTAYLLASRIMLPDFYCRKRQNCQSVASGSVKL